MDLTSVRTVDYEDAAAAALLPRGTRLGPAHLIVRDLARSVVFYESVAGLAVQWRGTTTGGHEAAAVGSPGDEPALLLLADPSARQPGRTAGLYHLAVRYERGDLAHVARRLAEQRVPIQGASDHGTHEAIYLPDPDGNGLELHADRPRAAWSPSMIEEFAQGGPKPLDVAALVEPTASQPTRAQAESKVDIGHVHLHVGDLAETERFYTRVAGFAMTAALDSAVFMAASGYHHHIAGNVWRGAGIPAAPRDVVGLRRWHVVVPDDDAVRSVAARAEQAAVPVATDDDGALSLTDPAGIVLVVESEQQRSAAEAGHERPLPPV